MSLYSRKYDEARLLLCITIVGIPFGLQFFKIAKVALMPFGAEVEREHVF